MQTVTRRETESVPSELLDHLEEFRRRIEEIMSRSKLTARDAEQAREAAELLRDLLFFEERAERFIAAAEPPPDANSAGPDGLAGLTLADAAERILLHENAPLHAREISVSLRLGGWTNPRVPDTKFGALMRQVTAALSRGSRFRRTAPNTFGLAAWGKGAIKRKRRQRPKLNLPTFSAPGISAKELTESDDAFGFDERNSWR